MGKHVIGIAMLTILGQWLACGGTPSQSTHPTENPPGKKEKLLVVTRPSEFKDEVVDRLRTRYEPGAEITTMDIAYLDDVRENDYDAMVVMGARMGFLMFSAKERHFLNRLSSPDKLVMVMTAAMQDWEWDRDDVDVITCASKPENVSPLYDKIKARLDPLLMP